ncbi:MAG: hypothetical protein GY878_05895 [Fuerstiella sp.]|nr:hypothetical protein [Fuerstiella sp.]
MIARCLEARAAFEGHYRKSRQLAGTLESKSALVQVDGLRECAVVRIEPTDASWA